MSIAILVTAVPSGGKTSKCGGKTVPLLLSSPSIQSTSDLPVLYSALPDGALKEAVDFQSWEQFYTLVRVSPSFIFISSSLHVCAYRSEDIQKAMAHVRPVSYSQKLVRKERFSCAPPSPLCVLPLGSLRSPHRHSCKLWLLSREL